MQPVRVPESLTDNSLTLYEKSAKASDDEMLAELLGFFVDVLGRHRLFLCPGHTTRHRSPREHRIDH